MSLLLNDDQLMLRDAVRRFAAERTPIALLRQLRDRADPLGFDRDAWKEMADLGWTGVLIPEEDGGVAFGHVGAGVIAQELGRTLAPTPLLSSAILGATALLQATASSGARALLSSIAAGELIVALAVDELPRHAPDRVATQAVGNGDGFRISGRKVHVLDGHVADKLIVSARVSRAPEGHEGVALFLVDAAATGVSIERVPSVDSRNAAVVRFEDTTVAGSGVIAFERAASVLERVLDAGRAVLAAELLGIAEESFERTLSYLREREQFGVKIGTFQALQHRAAHLYCEIELARSAVLRALQALDAADPDSSKWVSLAKAKAGEVARLATNEAVQMHGGIGMTDEFDIGFFMKRARGASETLGDAYYHADRFARLGGY